MTLLSCEPEKGRAIFYPVDSLVTEQIHYLGSIGAGLSKEALLAGETDSITYVPADTIAWVKELDIFRKLDGINKPLNQVNYKVSDGVVDPESNLKIKSITSLEDLPIVYLKIYYQGNIEKPRKIEAMYVEQNLLYKSARLLSMHFQQMGNMTVLTSYSVKGGQKMIFGDSVVFYISGKILID